MFNKTANPTPPQRPQTVPGPLEAAPRRAPAPAPASARAPSLLGPDLMFDGHIAGDGELHVEGNVKGEIQVARLVIGERATVEGVVRSAVVEVRGRVLGNIEAKAVKLYESAHVEGDITHEQLSIDVGAFFQGRCQQLPRQAAQPVAAPAPAPAPAAPVAKMVELEQAKA